MDQFLHLACEMAPYLLLGFFLAGLMHAFIPGHFYGKYLSGGSFRSVAYATLFGIPLPLCSCGVIPTAMSLRKEGASKGAVVSFLIATPQTGVDSIVATYGLMGLPFAVVRPLVALVTALFGGGLALMGEGERDDATMSETSSDKPAEGLLNRMKEALKYGFVTMMQDIGRWLVLGLAVAALITIGVPSEWFTLFKDSTWASMILVLCISVPMYVCATGSIPIAVALMLKGLTPGAALVLLMAGPACNLASMMVVRKVLGMRTLLIYLSAIVVGAVVFGNIIDFLHYHQLIDFLGQLTYRDGCCMEETSWFSCLSAIVLLLLLFNALVIQRYVSKDSIINSKSDSMKIFFIEGMSCNHCRMSAEKAILSVAGVTSATVDLQSKEARVEGTASAEEICKAVEAVGFKCTC